MDIKMDIKIDYIMNIIIFIHYIDNGFIKYMFLLYREQ